MSQNGVRCPNCWCMHTHVYKTAVREVRWGGKLHTHTRRFRECLRCYRTWSTVEVMEDKNNLGYPDPAIEPEVRTRKPQVKPSQANPYLPRVHDPDEEVG